MARPEIIVIDDDDGDGDDYHTSRLTPPPQQPDAVGGRRAVAFPASAPPKWRPTGGGILLGGLDDLPTSSRQSADALRVLDRTDRRRLPIPTPPSLQRDVFDHEDERRVVAFSASAPSKCRSSIDGMLFGRHEGGCSSLPTSPRHKKDEVDPCVGRRLPVLTPPPQRRDVVGDRRVVGFPASAPPKWRPSGHGVLVGHPDEPSLPEIVVIDGDDYQGEEDDYRASRLTPPPQRRDAVAFPASAPPKWRPSGGGILLGHRDNVPASSRQEADALRVLDGSAPPRQRAVFDHERRAVASASIGGMVFGPRKDGCSSLPTSPRQKRDEVDPSHGPRLSVLTPSPRHAIVGDRHAVAFPASAPPKWRPSGDGVLVGHPAEPSFFGVRNCRRVLFTPPAAETPSVLFRDPFEVSGDEEGDDGISTPPPPKRRSLFSHQPTDGESTLPKLSSSDIAKIFGFGSRDGDRGSCVPVFRDPFELPDDKEEEHAAHSTLPLLIVDRETTDGFGSRDGDHGSCVPVFRDPFELPDDEEEEHAAHSTLPLLIVDPETTDGESSQPSDRVGLYSGHGGQGSSQGRGGDQAGVRSTSCRGGRRGRSASPVGRSCGRVQVKHTGPGSRARRLADLLGDGDPRLTADGGPTPGQDLKEWEFERNMDLNQEYEYLDGLLTRIKALPEGGRRSVLGEKGWHEFYTRLDVCYRVRMQMWKAEAHPSPVPERFLPEVEYLRALKSADLR